MNNLKKMTDTANHLSVSSMTQMTTRDIATLTNKEHKNVKRDCLVMFSELEVDTPKVERIYLDVMNRQQTEYILDQELTFTLVTGYNTKLRNAVIKRWLDLEGQVVTLQAELNKWCSKEGYDRAIGSIHGKGLAERKQTKNLNTKAIDGILKKMQLRLDV